MHPAARVINFRGTAARQNAPTNKTTVFLGWSQPDRSTQPRHVRMLMTTALNRIGADAETRSSLLSIVSSSCTVVGLSAVEVERFMLVGERRWRFCDP